MDRSINLAPAIVESIKVIANAHKEKVYYDYLSSKSSSGSVPVSKVIPTEIVPGVKLNNYTNRETLEDNDTHVLVVEHKEYLEKIQKPVPPPTPEEVAAEKEERREYRKLVAKLWAGVAAIGVVVGGTIVVVDRVKNPRPSQPMMLENQS